MPRRGAFTLIELLVVVTIIVTLLALLVPSLEKAIYQAELAVCATKQGAIATSVIAYAASSQRAYPDRPGVRNGLVWHAAWIYNGNDALNAAYTSSSGAAQLNKYDDRLLLRTMLSLNGHLNDPLTGKLDFENIDADAQAYANYALWFGFRYKGHAGVSRLGDRITFDSGDGRGLRRYGLLVSDRDDIVPAGSAIQTLTAHPDADGVTVNRVSQNAQFEVGLTGSGLDSVKLTISTWRSVPPRGAVDLNYAYQDGSVARHTGVKYLDQEMDTLPDLSDARVEAVLTVPPQNR